MIDGWYKVVKPKRLFESGYTRVLWVQENMTSSGSVSFLQSEGATFESVEVLTQEELRQLIIKAVNFGAIYQREVS